MTQTTMPSPVGTKAIAPKGYQFQHGDRPLEGYTIQRGAGRGGFGEVYYALSDSGREVALKLVHTYEQIELRGIGQCMNLKSPHLITIFDVKYGQDGRPWVIMEFVSGPSLRELIDQSPSGLGTQKAAFFLREIGKGLTYLHDCGIVHRDLKPGNIFYENGYVKIGDYGLSKLISTTQHSGQTVTVGTVHYMAPEIGVGKYDKSIDIYALGALLFEMLTGQVPFFGASPTEVLMKHLSCEPDVSQIEEPFASVIKKAMAKDPAQRYQSVQEMVEAVFGSEHVRNSVSCFSPDSLSVVAGHVAQKITPSGGGSFTPSDSPVPLLPTDRWGRLAGRMDCVGKRFARFFDDKAPAPAPASASQSVSVDPFQRATGDPMRRWHRLVLALVGATLAAFVAAAWEGDHNSAAFGLMVWLGVCAATTALIAGWRLIAPALRHESAWLQRLTLGGIAGFAAILANLPFGAHPPGSGRLFGGTVLATFLGFLILEWPARLSASRDDRVSIGHLVTAALAGFILCQVFDGHSIVAMGVLVGTSLAAGLASGWNPKAPKANPAIAPGPAPVIPAVPGTPQPPSPTPVPAIAMNQGQSLGVMAQGQSPWPSPIPATAMPPMPPLPTIHLAPLGRPVHRHARAFWLAPFIVFATLGLMLLLTAPNLRNEEAALSSAFGIGSVLMSIFCLRQSRRTCYTGVWSYLFRPVLKILCLQSILISVFMLIGGNLHGDDVPFAIFFIVFPVVILFVLTFLIGKGAPMPQAPAVVDGLRIPPSGGSITLSGLAFGLVRFASTIAGTLLLLFAMLLTVAVVSNLPGLLASGAIDPQIPREMERSFDTARWPELMRQIGVVMAVIAGLAATALLLLPRRRAGAGYMFRGLAAIMLLFSAATALGRALPDWRDVVPGNSPGATIELYLDSVRMHGVLMAAGLLVLGMFMLFWPPRKPTAQ